ncbi:hypothetical protein Dimus_009773 [Dionaea muscipula]
MWTGPHCSTSPHFHPSWVVVVCLVSRLPPFLVRRRPKPINKTREAGSPSSAVKYFSSRSPKQRSIRYSKQDHVGGLGWRLGVSNLNSYFRVGVEGFDPFVHGRIASIILDQAKPLPKFGEWDVNDPSSAEDFSIIFNKARTEKKLGGQTDPPTKPESLPKHATVLGKPSSRKWFCCM